VIGNGEKLEIDAYDGKGRTTASKYSKQQKQVSAGYRRGGSGQLIFIKVIIYQTLTLFHLYVQFRNAKTANSDPNEQTRQQLPRAEIIYTFDQKVKMIVFVELLFSCFDSCQHL
jgi:hypothetical protein